MGMNRFGAVVRERREERKISLRRFAEMLGVSPTYLSKVERDDFDPPTPERVLKIALLLDLDPDVLLALANRVPDDLVDIFHKRPGPVAMLLRRVKGMSDEELERFANGSGANGRARPRAAAARLRKR
jgi:HTH-type transcriptional regulator, competence development regulator